MSLFRKIKVTEGEPSDESENISPPKVTMDILDEKINEEETDLRINENLIKIIENIVENYLSKRTPKKQSAKKPSAKKPKLVEKPLKLVKKQNGGNWLY